VFALENGTELVEYDGEGWVVDDVKPLTPAELQERKNIDKLLEEGNAAFEKKMAAEEAEYQRAVAAGEIETAVQRWDRESEAAKRTAAPITTDAPNLTAAPNLKNIRAEFADEVNTPTKPSPAALEFIEQEKIRVKTEQEAIKAQNNLARPATREAIEKEGYLYHFAPNKYAESISEKGIIANRASNAAQGPGKIFFWTDPSKATLSGFNPAGLDVGETLDLYKTKVTPEMLDSFQMDPKIDNPNGVARSVLFEADSFPAEKIGTGGVFDESTGGIKYNPITKKINTTPSKKRLITGTATARKKIAKFTSDPEELYRKYLKHLGDVKSEGGVLKGDIDTGYRVGDYRSVSDEAVRRLSNEASDDSLSALEQTVEALRKNKTFVDEQILNEVRERAHRSRRYICNLWRQIF